MVFSMAYEKSDSQSLTTESYLLLRHPPCLTVTPPPRTIDDFNTKPPRQLRTTPDIHLAPALRRQSASRYRQLDTDIWIWAPCTGIQTALPTREHRRGRAASRAKTSQTMAGRPRNVCGTAAACDATRTCELSLSVTATHFWHF